MSKIQRGTRESFAVSAETGVACCHSAFGRGWDVIGLEEALTGAQFAAAKAEVLPKSDP